MNKKTTLIEEKCIKANPRILDLVSLQTFVLYANETHLYLRSSIGGLELLECYDDEGEICFSHRKLVPKSECKSIGRPLRLADILKAFDGLTIFGGLPIGPQVENVLTLYGEVAGMWKLGTDQLEGQDEETINFIYEHLKNA